MLAHTRSVVLMGTDARCVDVEVDVDQGLPGFTIVGLPTASVREATQRVRSAVSASRFDWPQKRIVANLAPAQIKKDGTHLDLALAAGLIAASGQLDPSRAQGWYLIGELALDGQVRSVPGVLAAALSCRELGMKGVICPGANAPEAALVEGVEVVAVRSLEECLGFLTGTWPAPEVLPAEPSEHCTQLDMREVRGQIVAKEALEVAAAGGHNVLMVGPPGSGKTMLASRVPSIIPPMSKQESLDVTKVHSVAGLLLSRAELVSERPFRAPHHTVSSAGLVGGGVGIPHPGEISLAHHGVLFLDELPLFSRTMLETLRGPLEDGSVRIARSGGSIVYPCEFALIAAMNPCPCGYQGDPRRACKCTDHRLRQYAARLSGPLLDRFDMQVLVPRLSRAELMTPPDGEPSHAIRSRVAAARARQTERYGSSAVCNGSAASSYFEIDGLDVRTRSALGTIVEAHCLTGRGMHRLLRVARTVADLAGDNVVTDEHLLGALTYRVAPVAVEEVA